MFPLHDRHSRWNRLSALSLLAFAAFGLQSPAAERTLDPPPTDALRIEAAQLFPDKPAPVVINPRTGIGPDDAAILAVLMSPAIKSTRDRRGLATAQLIQAGVLPNPEIVFERDYVSGGATEGTSDGFSLNAGWEITSLLPLSPKLASAHANSHAVDLDIMWNEWQAAVNARLAVYRVVALEAELAKAREADRALSQTAATLQKAVATHQKTMLDLSAGESAAEDAHATALGLEQNLDEQRLALKRALGLEPDAELRLRPGIALPDKLPAPSQAALCATVEDRRIDLIGLRQGIVSQNETVRAAVLAAFPKISIAFVKARDTTDVHTSGFGLTVDLPLFDRNQGNIATERATRRTLQDEYRQRVFEARSDIATAIGDIRSLNDQVAAAREALPLLERLVNVSGQASAEGNTDVVALYEAQSTLIDKRVELIKLQEQLMETETALQLASGRMDPFH